MEIAIGIILVLSSLFILFLTAKWWEELDIQVVALVIGCAAIFVLGEIFIIDAHREIAINYYVNHQDESQVDTICINGVIDHYEVKEK